MVLFVVMFSAHFVVSHADHHCTGHDCPVCACIQQCENILSGAGGGFLFMSAGILPVVLLFSKVVVSYFVSVSDTLVSSKVRMNN